MDRIGCSRRTGLSVHDGPEYADALFKNLRVEISTGLFVVHTRWAVLPLSSKKVGKGKLKSIELEWAETTGNVRSHKIRANLKNGSKVYLTHLIEGDEYANALLGLVRSTIDGGK